MLKNFKIVSVVASSLFAFCAYGHDCPANGTPYACHDENTEWVCPEISEGQDSVYIDCMPKLSLDGVDRRNPLCNRHSSCTNVHCPGVKFAY